MILTDDNFATIVKAVELGRGLYDNLARYIRFQMGCLFGYIITFLGASIFNIAGGVPFLPLQTLWVSFTTLPFQSVGLGYGKPAAGLMQRPPQAARPADPDPGAAGLARLRRPDHGGRHPQCDQLGRTRSRARHRPDHGHGHVRAVHPVLLHRDQRRTGLAFSLDTFSDKTFVITTRVLRPAGPVHRLGIFQTVIKTVTLDLRQWLICIAAALSIVVAAEIQKAVLRRTAAT